MNRSFSKRKNKTMRLVSFVISLLSAVSVWGGEIKYPVSAIPQKLLKDADVVKRVEEMEFEINSTKDVTLHYRYVLTILNEKGDKYAGFSEWYDQFRHISSIEGYLYDAAGNQLKKVKTKDMQDVSAVDDISLIDDNRMKAYTFYYRSYPYTVEFDVYLKSDQTFNLPGWYPQEYPNLSVEKSQFTVITPQDYVLRYKNFNYTGQPVQTTEKSRKKYLWSVAALSSVKYEYASPRWQEITPSVSIAPSEFEMEGYKGNMSSWKEYGKFIYQLKKDKDVLPDNVKQKVGQLVAGAKTDVEKIQLLYQFLQQNTRYISIQLGIGGWQPFDAAYVSKKGYGDCKALSNYMYSLLKAAGIRSCYALIKAGDYNHYMIEDFPSNQFNHAILCVPLQKDTMWLECTSQTVPPGYMGEFTGNRKALLIDEDGGTLVSTPKYGLKENSLSRAINATLDASGTLSMKVSTSYGGTQQDDLSSMINALSKEKVQKILQNDLELASYNINNFSYQETKAILPELKEQLDVSVNNYATITGKRIFITPNILNRSGSKITEDTSRTVDLVFYSEYKDEDNYEIEIPEGYKPEAMPSAVSIKTKFGNYFSTVKLTGNKISYHRVMEKFSGRFPAKDQAELAKFYNEIYKADRSRVVLVKEQ
jgi:transglutaminase-like putative cysteine protease